MPNTTPTRRGRPLVPEQELLEKIHAATISLLQARGYEATSIDEIARTAGMAKKTIYRFYANKDRIIEQVILLWSSSIVPLPGAVPESSDDVLRALEEMLCALTQRVLSAEAIALYKLLQTPFTGREALLALYRAKGIDNARRLLREWFTTLRAKNLINPHWQPEDGNYLLSMAIAAPLRDMALGVLPPVPQTALRPHIQDVLRFVAPLLQAQPG
ncbi:TetR/AcrR family transcriptional regulator [Chimaeribacter californicus]|uniref:TetR/AcrR family transcriptional regulator n=1 Tax=Chimaeribacter californicus TaxID=2060067 RepID=A0A2N5DWM9_9GAMM|nr:TetR/AcrR family transcriptional regulator [Chimaeribacter californicus]PLR31658.1 TetR/AcrR family transcriptional regulator [Chimaeribacter californicus]